MKLLIVQCSSHVTLLRRDYRYQRGNQNPYIEEQTTQWPKENCKIVDTSAKLHEIHMYMKSDYISLEMGALTHTHTCI